MAAEVLADIARTTVDERNPEVLQHAAHWRAFYLVHMSLAWGVGGIPAVFLVDRQGRLRTTMPGDRLEAEVRALLEEPQGTAGR